MLFMGLHIRAKLEAGHSRGLGARQSPAGTGCQRPASCRESCSARTQFVNDILDPCLDAVKVQILSSNLHNDFDGSVRLCKDSIAMQTSQNSKKLHVSGLPPTRREHLKRWRIAITAKHSTTRSCRHSASSFGTSAPNGAVATARTRAKARTVVEVDPARDHIHSRKSSAL
jgi:hypothetical protein